MRRNHAHRHAAAEPTPDTPAGRPSIPAVPGRPAETREAVEQMDPEALLHEVTTEVDSWLAVVDWAEDEIAAASSRHPDQADLLYHIFSLLLLRPFGAGLNTEFVFRGHARELLERVVVGADLRPATAAEVCLTLAQVSQVVPMHGAAAGLYFRMWLAAFPDNPTSDDQAENQSYYEHLYGSQMDELEAMVRRKVGDPYRQLGQIECDGRHNDTTVVCRFASRGRPTP